MATLKKIVCIMILCCSFINVTGERTHKSLIRNDRVWEYYYDSGFTYYRNCRLYRYHFEGKETIDDIEYDVLWEIEVKEGYYDEFDEYGNGIFHEIIISDTPRKVAFMREKDGRIYTYNLLYNFNSSQLSEFIEYGKSVGEVSMPDTISKEFLIFDFNTQANQKNTIWFECRELKSIEEFPTILFQLECKPYKTDYVNIDSEECKQIYASIYFCAPMVLYNDWFTPSQQSKPNVV